MTEHTTPRSNIPQCFRRDAASPRRLVHLIPDELATLVPDHPLFATANSTNPRDGFTDISVRAFANGVNKASWFLVDTFGSPSDFDTVGYLGTNDLRYLLLMLAAIKVGYKMVFTSPRNNLDGHLNVLEKSSCKYFLIAQGAQSQALPILSRRKMRTAKVPELNDLLSGSIVQPYPYSKTFEEARLDPCLVLHTTGSTGLPKPIVWKNGMLSTYEAWRTVPIMDGYVPTPDVYQEARRAYTSMPLFHTSGINAAITWALSLGVTLVYGSPDVVPNASYVNEIHQHAQVDASMGAPSIYEDLATSPAWLEHMKSLKYVVASGAPLSRSAGDTITQFTRIIGNLGATETANLPRLCPSATDWQYYYWHPTHSGIEMREYMDGLYELVIVRKPEIDLYQGAFYAFPNLEEWFMNDLYDRHPDKPFLWRYRGRKDDVIVLSNGEKVSPALLETALTSSPFVKGAMIVGSGHFQPMALLDLVDTTVLKDEERLRQLVDELQPVIDEANVHAPAHAKLDRHHIIFAEPQRPIHYLGQGKIQRRITYKLYEDDIISAYKQIEESTQTLKLDLSEGNAVPCLQSLIADFAGQDLKADDDFFKLGIDSLQVIKIARAIGGIPPTVVYQYPTISSLAAFLVNHNQDKVKDDIAYEDDESNALREMQTLLGSYGSDLPRPTAGATRSVILTGSTGSLGSYILESLYHDRSIKRIVCLNRAADGFTKQRDAAADRGLTTKWMKDRVRFLQADLSAPSLGLEHAEYERLVRETTHVIHNQWAVNFHWRVKSFDPFIRGVRNLIDLCLDSDHQATLLFISSVSAVGKWADPNPVPEAPIHDLSTAALGYGQAKLVSECLIEEAATISSLRAAVCRVGVVAGPTKKRQGRWNPHEYIPALIHSSVHLGLLPETFPGRDRVDWLPVDAVAPILVEILDYLDTLPALSQYMPVYHLVNPNPTSWQSVVSYIQQYTDLPTAPFDVWLERLEASLEHIQHMTQNPAVKLVDFYRKTANRRNQPRTLTGRAEKASKTLRAISPVSLDWIALWMEQWGVAGEKNRKHLKRKAVSVGAESRVASVHS